MFGRTLRALALSMALAPAAAHAQCDDGVGFLGNLVESVRAIGLRGDLAALNRTLPDEERLSLAEYSRFRRSDALPSRHTPSMVARVEFAQIQLDLQDLQRTARETRYMSWGVIGAVDRFLDVFVKLSAFETRISRLQAFEAEHGLPPSALRRSAKLARNAAQWHTEATFRVSGFNFDADGFKRKYEAGLASWVKLGPIAEE